MVNIVWLRRDLRINDHAALYYAGKSDLPIQLVFVFDKSILSKLPQEDARVGFIHQTITELNKYLQSEHKAAIQCFYDTPEGAFKTIISQYKVNRVFFNRDYEPEAIKRDNQIEKILKSHSIGVQSFKDHVIFEKDEVLKKDNTPYTVFTPYKRKWIEKMNTKGEGKASYYMKSYPSEKYAQFNPFQKQDNHSIPTLGEMGFSPSLIPIPAMVVPQSIIKSYDKQRNFPALKGTSRLGIHFRFGTISIREKARKAIGLNETYLSELIWRDFYSQIMAHFPHVIGKSFRAKYDRIPWRFDENEFKAWCEGRTGYPLVDAGMRELNETGFMHNRVRMVVASFLCKHLLMNWQLGEAYFAKHLLDFDLASNNGGWQWAAGCGTDAAPYFRIFNPTSQLQKFDKEMIYVKKWVPEYGTDQYPDPIVDHKFARERCLSTYKSAIN